MAVPENTSVDHKLFIGCTSIILITIVIYPWILGVSLGGFLIGFYLLDSINEYIQHFIIKFTGNKNLQNVEASVITKSKTYLLDPLLHTSPTLGVDSTIMTTGNTNIHENEIKIGCPNDRGTNSPVKDTCSVCDEENCPRSDEKFSSPAQKRKHQHHESKGPTTQLELRLIDERLDKSVANFCKSVFDFYISSDWAPYETRKQLKLAFKKLLTNFVERLQSNLVDDDKTIIFCQNKVIPLVIHYIEKLRTSNNNSQLNSKTVYRGSAWKMNVEKMANLKTRRLCRQLLEATLPQEDQQCRLWVELCVTVLSDGVLWNLILLGRNKLPNVLLNYVEAYTERSKYQNIARPPSKDIFNFICDTASNNIMTLHKHFTNRLHCAQSQSPSKNNACASSSDNDGVQSSFSVSSVPELKSTSGQNQIKSTTENSIIATENNAEQLNHQSFPSYSPAKSTTTIENKVPFLVDSFLDPSNDLLTQPDEIVSRWRPTLEEILVERDLLYCLIQYLKGHRALEYLQAVLDDSPDGNVYCRKVLQLEYLPGFCRSKFFMESLGISQVDFALEAGNDSPGTKRKHVRSSSYGSVNSGIQIWKIGDPKVVEGMPLGTSMMGGGREPEEPDTVVKHRPHSIEAVIKKFLRSATKPAHLSKPEDSKKSKQMTSQPTRRVGINPKSYDDLLQEDVVSQVIIAPCDIYESTSEVAISWMNGQYWLQPIISGWAQLLKPYLKSPIESAIASQLHNFLSLETLIYLIDLVTEAFHGLNAESEITQSSSPVPADKEENPKEQLPSQENSSQENTTSDSMVKMKESLVAALHWFFNQIVDPKTFAHCLKDNEDEIILFFVDLLDLLVKEVTVEGES